MDSLALVAAAALMGLAGMPHCVAMCAAPCTAVAARAQPVFQTARIAGYAAAGAVAAAGVGALRELLAVSPLLKPLWTLLHLLALAVGLWMLWQGRWPAPLQRQGAAAPRHRDDAAQPVRLRLREATRAGGAGLAWIAWPCALSQSALLVAALANTPAQGAAAMAAFALASSPALWLGPWVWQRWRARLPAHQGARAQALASATWPVRAAGGLIALASLWALGHGLWLRFAVWCGLA